MAVAIVAPFAPRGPSYAARSTTERAIQGAGLLDLIVQPDLSYTPGMRLRISATASDSWMEGVVKTYAGTALTVEINLSGGGGGPYKDWNINLAGEPGIVPTYAGSATNVRLFERAYDHVFYLATLSGNVPTDVDVIRALFPNGTLRLITGEIYTWIAGGTTLGTVNSVPFRLWILLIDAGGVLKLGLIQTRNNANNSIQAFPPNGIIPASMFAGPGATAGKVYTLDGPIGVASPYIVLGFADYDTGLTTAGNWNASPTRIVMFGPGIKLPGDELQTQSVTDGTYAGFGVSGALIIPIDNTIPQIGEGAVQLPITITPRCPQSVLEIEAQVLVSQDPARMLTAALFSNRSSNAIVTTWTDKDVATVYLWCKDFALTTNAINYQVNIGLDANGNMEKNGSAGTGKFGGTGNTYIQIVERQT